MKTNKCNSPSIKHQPWCNANLKDVFPEAEQMCDCMTNKLLEKIKIIETIDNEVEFEMNFAMLLAYTRVRGGTVKLKIGSYSCLFTVLEEND